MRKTLVRVLVITTGLISCGQANQSGPVLAPKDIEKSHTADTTNIQKREIISIDPYLDTKYVYTDTAGQQIIFENSLPKGGLTYAAPNGKEYVYAIFWTQITNETAQALELTLEFPEKEYALPSSTGRNFQLYIPSDTLAVENVPLFNYGLDLENYLDENFQQPAKLLRTISPESSGGFYIITLFNQGVDGTLRTGLRLQEQTLFYRINEVEIDCGRINLKHLKPKH